MEAKLPTFKGVLKQCRYVDDCMDGDDMGRIIPWNISNIVQMGFPCSFATLLAIRRPLSTASEQSKMWLQSIGAFTERREATHLMHTARPSLIRRGSAQYPVMVTDFYIPVLAWQKSVVPTTT